MNLDANLAEKCELAHKRWKKDEVNQAKEKKQKKQPRRRRAASRGKSKFLFWKNFKSSTSFFPKSIIKIETIYFLCVFKFFLFFLTSNLCLKIFDFFSHKIQSFADMGKVKKN